MDILGDNVATCRKRLFRLWHGEYVRLYGKKCGENVLRSARTILERNIVRGNALSMKLLDGEARDTDEPIVFSQWTLFDGGLRMRREDFDFASLLTAAEADRAIVPDAVPGADGERPASAGNGQQALFGEPPEPRPRFLGSRFYPSRRIFET